MLTYLVASTTLLRVLAALVVVNWDAFCCKATLRWVALC